MPSVKVPAALAIAALALAGCGSITVQPRTGSRGRVDDAAVNNIDHLACIRGAGLPATEVAPERIQVGALPTGPTVVFTPTPGAAQAAQIYGQAQGAEVIGSALLWVHQGSDAELQTIEDCLAPGVTN